MSTVLSSGKGRRRGDPRTEASFLVALLPSPKNRIVFRRWVESSRTRRGLGLATPLRLAVFRIASRVMNSLRKKGTDQNSLIGLFLSVMILFSLFCFDFVFLYFKGDSVYETAVGGSIGIVVGNY